MVNNTNNTGTRVLVIIVIIILIVLIAGSFIWAIRKVGTNNNNTKTITITRDGDGKIIENFSNSKNNNQTKNNNILKNNNKQPQLPLSSLILKQQNHNGNKTNGNNAETLYVLYYFYNPSCPACIKFNPEWNRLVYLLSDVPGLELKPLNIREPNNKGFVIANNIKSTPSFVLSTPHGDFKYENPNYAIENLYWFINQHYSQHEIYPDNFSNFHNYDGSVILLSPTALSDFSLTPSGF